MKRYDLVIIGGGFFGCEIANYLASRYSSILILEKSASLMTRASYVNQARVHNGYHYPKSLLTAIRSRVNFEKFCLDYKPAIYKNFSNYYAVGRRLSSVSDAQYLHFCDLIKAEIASPEPEVKALFVSQMVSDIFKTKEYAFDAVRLSKLVKARLRRNNITIRFSCTANYLSSAKGGIKISTNSNVIYAKKVINSTYSGINQLNYNSGLSIIPIKNELTEMLLLKTPPSLSRLGITIMCGPFFSLMPFPARKLHTLSHVRYTPHLSWVESAKEKIDYEKILKQYSNRSAQKFILADAARYVPEIAKSEYVDSLWEIKSVLPSSEKSDSRPILFYQSRELPGYFCLMGGKIDNIYDIWEEIDNNKAFKDD